MGLLSEAKNFVDDTFSAASPPPPLSKIRSHPSARASASDGATGANLGSRTYGGMDNPYMVLITGTDKGLVGTTSGTVARSQGETTNSTGGFSIDGILQRPFDIPLSAQWAPVLPQYAQDLIGAAGGIAKSATMAAAQATQGSQYGGYAAVAAGLTRGLADTLAQAGPALNQASNSLTGESLTNPSWYQLIWQGNDPTFFTLPLVFVTMDDPERDVIDPIITLQKLILPSFQNGSMRSPGYHPFDGWSGAASAVGSLGKSGMSPLGKDYKMDVHIGNTCVFHNVVISQVNSQFSHMPSIKGKKFHRVDCDVSFFAQQVLTKDSMDEIFKRKKYVYGEHDPVNATEQQFSDLKGRVTSQVSSALGNAANTARGAVSQAGNFLSGVSHLGGL